MNKLIIALDNMNKNEVKSFISNLISQKNITDKIVFKVNDLLAEVGFEGIYNIVENIRNNNQDVSNIKFMIDGKWNDIPNTIVNYFDKLQNSKLQNIEFVTIMASGGYDMMKKIVERKKETKSKTKIFAVTILTSMDNNMTYNIFEDDVKHSILRLAKLALDAGVDGLVCSPNDTMMLRNVFSNYDFELMTPGIRLEENNVLGDDQVRINTPKTAISNGANHIVVGRPITQATNNIDIINNILFQIFSSYYQVKEENNFEKVFYNGSWEQILKYIGAIYIKGEKGKYVRLASKLLSNGYINIGIIERNFRLMQKAGDEISKQINELSLKPDIIIGAQMGSVRFSSFVAKSLGIEQSIYSEKEEIVKKDDLNIEIKVEEMKLKRHDIDLNGKKVILCEDVITKGSTIIKMIDIVTLLGGKVIGISCIVNRTGKDNFEGISIFSCYNPKPFNFYYDENTPSEQRLNYDVIPSGSLISEKPKNSWQELVESMRN